MNNMYVLLLLKCVEATKEAFIFCNIQFYIDISLLWFKCLDLLLGASVIQLNRYLEGAKNIVTMFCVFQS